MRTIFLTEEKRCAGEFEMRISKERLLKSLRVKNAGVTIKITKESILRTNIVGQRSKIRQKLNKCCIYSTGQNEVSTKNIFTIV